ncbi:MAG: hypothetical protein KGH57_04475 [Candidatus Micrarchaeota archaeon]|nr:hypothetical protein [Candidatus Micrarchaeota archaeon]
MATFISAKVKLAIAFICGGLALLLAANLFLSQAPRAIQPSASTVPTTSISLNETQNLSAAGNEPSPKPSNPIKHVIVIFQENRAFDTFFGTYPGAYGIQNGTCIPINLTNSSAGCVRPFLMNSSQAVSPDFPHAYPNMVIDKNGGKMDGFITEAQGCKSAVGYFDNRTIPYYWDYAKNFVLSDNTFQSVSSYSPANHWALIAALSPIAGFLSGAPLNLSSPLGLRRAYVHEASSIPTLTDLMTGSNKTWKYYDKKIPLGLFNRSFDNGSVLDFWNPFEAVNASYTARLNSHFVLRGKIFSDINSSSLPNVSYVIPSAPISDHAPANITWGMWWVASIVNSVGRSKYWNSTVIIVTWDDFGGWYDGVFPPVINASTDGINGTIAIGAGPRVPLLIISPYARRGYVDHTLYTFSSIMKLIETTFNITSLNVRDKTANDMLGALNFSQKPLAPLIEPLNLSQMAIVNKWAFTSAGDLSPAQNQTGGCAQLALTDLISETPGTPNYGFVGYNPD